MYTTLMRRAVRVLERALDSKTATDEVKGLAAGAVLRITGLDIMRSQLDTELERVSEQLSDIQRRLGKKAK